jgi:hypothetical protein
MPTSGLSGAPPDTIALIRPPKRLPILGFSVRARIRFIGWSQSGTEPGIVLGADAERTLHQIIGELALLLDAFS